MEPIIIEANHKRIVVSDAGLKREVRVPSHGWVPAEPGDCMGLVLESLALTALVYFR